MKMLELITQNLINSVKLGYFRFLIEEKRISEDSSRVGIVAVCKNDLYFFGMGHIHKSVFKFQNGQIAESLGVWSPHLKKK